MNANLFSLGGLSIDGAMVERLGWTLVHFLWQGAMVAAGLALADLLLARSRPQHRYLAGCVAMVAMLVFPIVTFATLGATLERTSAHHGALRASTAVTTAIADAAGDRTASSGVRGPAVRSGSERRSAFASLVNGIRVHALLPWMVGFWAAGVALLSLRLLGGWWLVARLSRSARNVPIGAWQGALDRLARDMGIGRTVKLVRSGLVTVPTAVGWLSPVILIPASTLTGLSAAQIEAILAHELAHIRRHDYLVNLVQSVVEILLFYHPAVWWVSRRVRDERELCCDDLAVRASGDPVSYANALFELERLRGEGVPMALAATGGSLLARIARLVGASERPHFEASRGLAWALVASLVVIGGAARSAVRVNITTPLARATVAAPAPVLTAPAVLAALATEITAPAARSAAEAGSESALGVEAVLAAGIGAPEIGCETPKPSEAPEAVETPETPEQPLLPTLPERTPPHAGAPSAAVMRRFSSEEWERLSQHGVGPTYVENLTRVGYPDLSFDDLVKLAQHGVMSAYAGTMRRILGEPSVDDLVNLANHGVTTRYTAAMTEEIGDLSVDDLVRLSNAGISTSYVAGMHRLDLGDIGVEDLVRLANSGVTLEWFSALRWMGYSDLTVENAIELRNAGVTPDYAASLRILNRHQISLDDLRTLRNQGVEVEYAAAMLGVLRRDLTPEDLIHLRNQGVTVHLVAALNALGYSALSSDELITLTQQGVEPEYIASLKAAGYSDLSVRELVKLRQSGVDGDFVEEVRRAGHGKPEVPELIRMRQRGIPKTNPVP
jgi:beta-lactamase regulating signal transducer with metallopeptidase domain